MTADSTEGHVHFLRRDDGVVSINVGTDWFQVAKEAEQSAWNALGEPVIAYHRGGVIQRVVVQVVMPGCRRVVA